MIPWRPIADIKREADAYMRDELSRDARRQSLWRMRRSRLKRWYRLLVGRAPLEFVIDPITGDVRRRRGFE